MKKQHNSRSCFVCGLENPYGLQLSFYEVEPGEIRSSFTPPEKFQGFPGVLHGGITATILDEAVGRAHMGIDPPRFMYTAKIEVKYRKKVPVMQPLSIRAVAGKSKGRTAEAWAGIYDSDGVLLAEAEALLVDVPIETFESVNLKEMGWKIYPD